MLYTYASVSYTHLDVYKRQDYVDSTDEWGREFCAPFLDGPSSRWWSRLLWLPGGIGESGRVYGDYCLLRRK